MRNEKTEMVKEVFATIFFFFGMMGLFVALLAVFGTVTR